jgi:hypothetical protein
MTQVSTLELFQSILKVQASLPKDQPHKDLIQLINFILRKFFKNAKEHPMLLIEVRDTFHLANLRAMRLNHPTSKSPPLHRPSIPRTVASGKHTPATNLK